MYAHLKPKTFKNLDETAREADLFAEARAAYLVAYRKGNARIEIAKRLPVLHRSADYIFISFGIIGPIVVSLKMEFCSCIRLIA